MLKITTVIVRYCCQPTLQLHVAYYTSVQFHLGTYSRTCHVVARQRAAPAGVTSLSSGEFVENGRRRRRRTKSNFRLVVEEFIRATLIYCCFAPSRYRW